MVIENIKHPVDPANPEQKFMLGYAKPIQHFRHNAEQEQGCSDGPESQGGEAGPFVRGEPSGFPANV